MGKWRSYKIGNLKITINGLRSIHTCNSRDPRLPGTNIVGRYHAIHWRGVEKFKYLVSLEN